MKIKIIGIGKIKEKYLNDGIAAFVCRVNRKYPVEMIELPDEKTPQGASLIVENKIKETEGKRILARLGKEDYLFALDMGGCQYSTPQLGKKLLELERGGIWNAAFVIGGSLGLSGEVLKRAKVRLSFSAMTFPHQLMRLILMEQLDAAIYGKALRG